MVSLVMEDGFPCTVTVSRPACRFESDTDIAHEANGDVDVGLGLGKSLGGDGDACKSQAAGPQCEILRARRLSQSGSWKNRRPARAPGHP